MTRISSLILLLSAVVTANAQSTFLASLAPEVPMPDSSGIPASAEFSLHGSTVGFTIRFGLEGVVPATAHLRGTSSELAFELGAPFTVIHSPGPWPDGYDGSTTFSGSFLLPDTLPTDLVGGMTTLFLPGSVLGDVSGAVLPASTARPVITRIDREGSALRIHFAAEPPYRYLLEYANSVETPNWLPLTNITAEIRTNETVVTDDVTNASARFYRVRKEHLQSGVVGQVFLYGCPVQGPGIICYRPYQTSITVVTADGDSVAEVRTDKDGHFEISLKPGDYVLIPDGAGGLRLPSVEAVSVRVEKKQFTTVRVVYDSGMR